MGNISVEVWLWFFSSIAVIVLSVWAIIDGYHDLQAAYERQVGEELWPVGIRGIRNGIITYLIGSVALGIALLVMAATVSDDVIWRQISRTITPWALISILVLNAGILAWDRFERHRLLRKI